MHRFFTSSQNISGDKITISDKGQAHHIKDVLRLRPENEVIVCNEQGNEYIAVIEQLLPQNVILRIKEKYNFIASLKLQITVACAIPKKSKMDDIIDKLTQLGVERIIPLKTERVVAKLDKHKAILRQARWKKIALSASQQSQRKTLAIIEPIEDIKMVLSESGDFDLKLIPTLIGRRKPLKDVFVNSAPKNVLLLIGPEGDFTAEEVDLAKRSGCIPVSLGDLVLRVETAAVALVSFIRLYGPS